MLCSASIPFLALGLALTPLPRTSTHPLQGQQALPHVTAAQILTSG